jgi:hypothetical protein
MAGEMAGEMRCCISVGGVAMTGLELLAAAAVGYLVRKARRVGTKADAEVDRVLDAGMDALHDAVSKALGPDSSLALLDEQAQAGADTERTRQRVQLAIEQAAEDQAQFADQLRQLVDHLEAADAQAGGGARAAYGAAAGRDIRIHAESGGAAAVNMQGPVVTSPNPPQPGPDHA